MARTGDPPDYSYLAVELQEAKSEIRRHHELIPKLRDGLYWALYLLKEEVHLHGDDVDRVDDLLKLLNHGVG